MKYCGECGAPLYPLPPYWMTCKRGHHWWSNNGDEVDDYLAVLGEHLDDKVVAFARTVLDREET